MKQGILIEQKQIEVLDYDRPFICDGLPKINSIMLVGYNPATTMRKQWIEYWSNKNGFDYNKWEFDYKMDRLNNGKRAYSATRNRINYIKRKYFNDLLETNIWPIASKSISELKAKNRSIILDLIRILKPTLIILHGKGSQKEFTALITNRQNITSTINKLIFDGWKSKIIMTKHFSRISYSELDDLFANAYIGE